MARGPRHDGHDLRGEAPEVVARLSVRDLVQLAQAPDAREAGNLGLSIGRRSACEIDRFVRLGLRHAGLEALVHEQSPDLLVRHPADQLLDVDASVAEGSALAVRLGDLGLDGDDALEPRAKLNRLAHPAGRYLTADSRGA